MHHPDLYCDEDIAAQSVAEARKIDEEWRDYVREERQRLEALVEAQAKQIKELRTHLTPNPTIEVSTSRLRVIDGDAFRARVNRLARKLGWDADGDLRDDYEIVERAPMALEFIESRLTPKPMDTAPRDGTFIDLVVRVRWQYETWYRHENIGWLPLPTQPKEKTNV